ncbi:hypothetical protein FNV43_RR17390 [Rhamnella rubrinervis]|uniref:Epidermal patterning factor-like protein n=1 Tax=Rhamnella rubrinervis TaxID=2594499 RepID=A0A8K0DXF7_9ROSA|nr:hypothetical protein FNV43_RR17390 [Rhamnella rubrinervis]
MGCMSHSFICSSHVPGSLTTISLLFLLILSSAQLRFMAEGRAISKRVTVSQTVKENKTMVRAQIGSRPPRCERRCSSCGHCEAIQVPANPQVKAGNRRNSSMVVVVANIDYARGDDNSNYKPMSWKCKCGNFIFNP